ncbi:MAG: hypothetical protein AAF555_09205 [Verrucomicrobiota bacterium]
MKYPLDLRFKVLAFAPQLTLHDAEGTPILYVRQKLFRFKEKVEVFQSKAKEKVLATIEADRIIDWSAKYAFALPDGRALGSVGRKGMRSIWRAHYEVSQGDSAFLIREENPWAKVGDGLLGDLPIIGLLSAVLFHPKYLASGGAGATPVMRLTKKPAFFEGKFEIEKLADDLSPDQEMALLFSFLMMILLERSRG